MTKWNWICRVVGHWRRRGKVMQLPCDWVADYTLCRICGRYNETLRPGWTHRTFGETGNKT